MSLAVLGTIATTIAPWLGEWAIVGLAGKLGEGAVKHFKPDEMALLLKQSIATAEAAQPQTGALFDRCHHDGHNGVKKFLEQFFQSGEVLRELKKPLQDKGKPDLAILIAAFKASAQQHPEAKQYLLNSLPLWMETFVESYFEQIKGICFLKQLARRVDDVKFVGIAVPGEEVEKQEVLAQIFVMPDVRRTKNRDSADDIDYGCIIESAPADLPEQEYQELVNYVRRKNLLQEQRGWATRDRSAPRIPAQKVINLAQKKAVVLGAPGSGKTMLASYFALMLCETAQSDPTQIGLEKDADYLPVVVRIRDWILEPKMGLLEYLRSNAEASLACKELPTGFFEHWLDRGRALILLDGLDEVVDEAQRSKVAEQIETFLHQYNNNPAVITSRPSGYRWDFFNLDEFPHYTLESFDDKQVATFLDHWYDNRAENRAQADRLKADLQKAFARNERIKLLAKNPLLLTITALIHRYQADLPKQRYKLYEKAVETLLISWDSGKEIKLYSQVLLFLKSDDLLYILKKLAYWIHTQGSTGETEGGTMIDKDELIQQLRVEIQKITACKTHEAKAEAERFVDFIQKRTGLLNEQGRDRYAFVHKTFQEYLTAEEIYEIDESGEDTEIIEKHFREHLHDQHWREVLLLLVSKLKGKKAQNAIETVLFAESEYGQWLHRDLLFAGWCLTEDPSRLTVVAKDFVGGILDRLICLETGDSGWIGRKIKGEVGRILSCFSETTLEMDVWAKLKAQEDRIDRLRMIGFQASFLKGGNEIDTLLSWLNEKESVLCYFAATALGELGNTSPEVVNSLLSLLRNRESFVQSGIATALGKLGDISAEVLSSLRLLLHDEESHVRAGAAEALGELRSASQEVVNDLLPLLCDTDSRVCYVAAEALVNLGHTSSGLINYLLSLIGDKQPRNLRAAETLVKLGDASPDLINYLLFFINDDGEEPSARFYATELFVRLGHTNPEIVNSLLSSLKNQDKSVRIFAATALIQLGDVNSQVISVLLPLFKNESSSALHNSATTALVHLGNASPKVLENLLPLLNEKNSCVSEHEANTLLQMANPSLEVVNGLLSLMTCEESFIRQRAEEVLMRLSKTSDKIAPLLAQWLDQNSDKGETARKIDCLWSIVVE
jgi:HEAT repeat protein